MNHERVSIIQVKT